jgi:hypothetical protein
MLLPVAAALWGSGYGCGGVVTDSGRDRDAGPVGAAATGGRSSIPVIPPGPGPGGSKPRPPSGASCGNGIVEGEELCDGNSFRSDVDTCGEALMAPYYGQLYCTGSCTLDTSGCYQSFGGRPPMGGAPNGGSFGYAGRAGGGGMLGLPTSPAQACYSRGGVPDPVNFNGCYFGVDATDVCNSNHTTCSDKCGCSFCPSAYDQCKSDGACAWTFDCAKSLGCYSVSSCMRAGCSSIISLAGGPNTPSAALLDQVLACYQANNCLLPCQ